MAKLALSFKGKLLKHFPLRTGNWSIGRDKDCDLSIDSLAVSPVNAYLNYADGIATLEAKPDSADVYVNHQKINKHALIDNDMIRIGKHTLVYSVDDFEDVIASRDTGPETEPEVSPIEHKSGWLQILSGANMGKTIQLKTSLTDLGKLGMKPVLIARHRDGYYVSNLSNDVSLKVNDTNIGEQRTLLEDGVMINVGNIQLQFYLQEE